MARLQGSRNAQYADRRHELMEKVRSRLAQQSGAAPSFRELALAAGVSVATLRHYFGSRDALVKAVFTTSREDGERHLVRARAPEVADLRLSMQQFLARLMNGWERGRVGELHRIGLAEGLRHPGTGLDYLTDILEPSLQALEQRLATHVERGEMRPADLRHAALMLLSPILFALLHQRDLGGTRCRPLHLPSLVEAHVEVFVRAYEA